MSANIFGERFLGHREPAWHGIGQTFDKPLTAVKAAKKAGLDYGVVKLPLAGQVETKLGTQLVVVDNKIMIAREPTKDDPEYRFFGIASPDYGLIQNMDIAKALDTLTETWPVETVGALGAGETVFFVLDAGKVEIKGEQIHEYFLVTDTKDGGTSMKIAYTPVRVVCQNTLVSGLRQATISTAIEHHAGIEGEFTFRIGLVDQMIKAQKTVNLAFESLASVVMRDEDLEYILERAYPMPKKPKKATLLEESFDEDDIAALGDLYHEASEANQLWEYYCNRVDVFRTGARELFGKINDEYQDIAKTPWAAYNAVVECADYRQGSDTVQISALFGARAAEKKRAFKASMEVLNELKADA